MDKLLATEIDRDAIIASFDGAVEQLATVADAAHTIASSVDLLIMVACGAGYHCMVDLLWWCDTIAKKSVFRTYTAADYLSLGMPWANDCRTLILMVSKSGETTETVEVAKATQFKACRSVIITQSPQSSLATYADIAFYTGYTSQAFQAIFMLTQAFMGGIWAKKEAWTLLPQLLTSLRALPATLALVAEASDEQARAHASRYREGDPLYFLSAGAGKATTGSHGLCLLEENLALVINTVGADHFFHSNLEFVNQATSRYYILIVPEGAGRDQMDRVRAFFKRFGGLEETYDTRGDPMKGIDPDIRPLLGPIMVEAKLKRFARYLADNVGRPIPSELKYMGKTVY